jgi:hypothetical protein
MGVVRGGASTTRTACLHSHSLEARTRRAVPRVAMVGAGGRHARRRHRRPKPRVELAGLFGVVLGAM